MALIGLNGKAQSGKDTVGKYLQYLLSEDSKRMSYSQWILQIERYYNQNDWQIKKFADKLKDIVCILIGCTRADLEDNDFKNSYLGEEWWYYRFSGELIPYLGHELNLKEWKNTHIKLTPRLLLQLLGTEAGREIIHPNIWVNALMKDYKPISNITTSNSFSDSRLNHGYNKTKIWRTYHNIKQRCNNLKHPRYEDYGGRGIKMCEEWENNIESFINWSKKNGYNDSLTIDRIDVNGNYSPLNCRCVSYSTQAINTTVRKDNTSGFRGVSKDKHNWRADIQIAGKKKFLGYYDTAEEASEIYELTFLERENLYLKEEEKNLIYPSWLVTDVRFPNEAKAIEDRGGVMIRVERTNFQDGSDYAWGNESSNHESETALDSYKFHFTILNNGTLQDLYKSVDSIIHLIKKRL